MFGLTFWSFVFLASVLGSSAQEKNFERCFLYPVNETKSSPLIHIESQDSLSVTIKHMREPNVVRFFDQTNKCVVALRYMTSEQMDCASTFNTTNEFTTLVFRRQDGRLTVRTPLNFGEELTLPGDIKTLQVNSSKMVYIVFDCRLTDCYKFGKAKFPTKYKDQKPVNSTLNIYGKIKSSADNWKSMIKVNDFKPFSFTTSKFLKNKWYSVKFNLLFEWKNNTAAKITISDHERPIVFTSLFLPKNDLYLNFEYSENVTWAVNCKPPDDDTDEASGRVIPAPSSENEGLWIIFTIIGGLTFFLMILVAGLLLCRNRPPHAGCTPATDRRVFKVTVGEGTREKLWVSGDVRLLVENGHIAIISREGNRIAQWDVTHIRRFGFDDARFYFEAGRKSAHGEGRFDFITTEGSRTAEILRQETETLLARMVTRTTASPPQSSVQTLINTDDGYEVPLTFGEPDYEEIPGIPIHSSRSHHSYISLINGMEDD